MLVSYDYSDSVNMSIVVNAILLFLNETAMFNYLGHMDMLDT